MALIKCPECGKEISDKAVSCPNCGCPLDNHTGGIGNELGSQQQMVQQKAPNIVATDMGKNSSSGLSIAGFTVSVMSLLASCVWTPIPVVLMIVGFVLCFIGKRNKTYRKKGLAIAGEVICILTLVSMTFIFGKGTEDNNSLEKPKTKSEVSTEISQQTEKQTETENVTEQKALSPEEFKAKCQVLSYNDVARNPDDYVGQYFKIDVQISQALGAPWYADYEKYYKAYTDDGSGIYFDKMIWLMDYQDTSSDTYTKLLEDDIVTVYGIFEGMQETSNSITGEKGEDVALSIYYVELH